MKKKTMRAQSLLAEYLGTMMLSFVVMASLADGFNIAPTPVLAGLTLAVIVLVFGVVSGAHVNPGVTAGMVSVGRMPINTAIAYWVSQGLGAVSAVGLYKLLADVSETPAVPALTADFRIFVAEAIGVAIFTMGVASVIYQKLSGFAAAAAVGGSLFAGILFASVISNGVLNPAVAFTIGSFNWSYALGPIVGGIVGMNLFKAAFTAKEKIVS